MLLVCSLFLLPVLALDRPVIGILTVPNQGDYPYPGTSFLASSYVKWLESAGAVVIPLQIEASLPSLLSQASHLNGLLLPGGAVSEYDSYTGELSEYSVKLCGLYDWVKAVNAKGGWLPLWGTCLGLQMIHFCEARGKDTIGYSPNYPARGGAVNVTQEAYGSRLFSNPVGWRVLSSLSSRPIAFFSHNYTISPSLYSEHPHLQSFFTPLALSTTSSGHLFIALIEAVDYPIFASQFHPEVNLFEWHPRYRVERSKEGAEMSRYLANAFIREARKNDNRLGEEEVRKRVVYNWKKYYWAEGPSEVYMFSLP